MVLATFINIVKLGRLIAHAVILVYILGVLFALLNGASFDVMKFIIGYVILASAILAAVYTNNYNDVAIDKYATHTFFSGGSSILIDHPELMNTTRNVAITLYSVSILLGFAFTVLFSYPFTFFLFVLLGNLLGWCYTSPPVKLVYHGFGEVTTMIGAGFIVPGFAYFTMRGTIDTSFALFSIPLMFLALAISIYLELPDKNADITGQKHTFVVRRGERLGFLLGVISSCVVVFWFLFFAAFPFIPVTLNFWFIALFSLFPFIVGVWSLRKYYIDPTKIVSIVFPAVSGIFVVFILIDIYFAYLIFT
jgi:1,4-dihydroxy-2-naphthoate polyprenyltransferase